MKIMKCKICNEEKELSKNIRYKNTCEACIYQKQKESIRKYQEKNKEKLSNYSKVYRVENIDKRKEYNEKYKPLRNDYMKNRRKCPIFKAKENIKCLIKNTMLSKSHINKPTKFELITGLNAIDFKKYIESMFEPWMNWENYGKSIGKYNETWQLDHIIPLNTAQTVEDVYKLNHYSNLRPLCSRLNGEQQFRKNKKSNV